MSWKRRYLTQRDEKSMEVENPDPSFWSALITAFNELITVESAATLPYVDDHDESWVFNKRG